MNIEELWQRAITKTEIYRARIRYLYTFDQTELPYVYLAESTVNPGDVVVRQGRITAEKPMVILPGGLPQFEGFEINDVAAFLFLRGVSFPNMKYSNQTQKLDVVSGPLSKVVLKYKRDLERKEDVSTGLVVSPEDCWQFSVMIYAAALAAKSIPQDIQNILKRMGIQNN